MNPTANRESFRQESLRGVVYPDHALFHITIPRLLAEEDPGRYYQPSSPCSPDGLFPNADDVGDQHPWTVGMANTDFRDYRKMICRFPNEGGTLGPTSLPTMLACLPMDQSMPAVLPPNASTRIASFKKREWKRPAASAAFAMLMEGDVGSRSPASARDCDCGHSSYICDKHLTMMQEVRNR